MSDQSALSRFRVEGLRGQRTIDARIKNNTLVLVGENGSGKTTFLRLMFYFLSGRWAALCQFQFDRIAATINGVDFNVSYADIEPFSTFDRKLLAALPPTARRRVQEAEVQGRWQEVHRLTQMYFGRSAHGPFDDAKLGKLDELQSVVGSAIGAQILYLPTYRRIERELSSIFQNLDIDEVKKQRLVDQSESDDSYIELVEFGMNDVERAIRDALEGIRSFANTGLNSLTLSYLGDVVSQSYLTTALNEISEVSEETMSSVLNRISSTILREDHKKHLREIVVAARSKKTVSSEHELIILHYFTKLLQFQSQLQEKEADIRAFCELASDYIVDKKFVYDTQRFSFRIEWAGKGDKPRKKAKAIPDEGERAGDVRLSDLSSGEKQIVSLFSHLYLSGRDRYFVLIDEPELSLSVPWQRRFLEDIRNGSFCSGLVAVTHSPFIYDNSLRRHTHALGEFIKGADWGHIQ